ncbi:bifunctional riboflavin kinase/FAD synthetase [Marinicella sp. W31]|uniref:bifunctional riboflavin kinase/FAD synthetase n=1 Tax=Marinicella sp. W31 TaxID=3023713 RepID=UPI00375670D4
MQLIRYPHNQSLSESSVITIGNFDGVHLGHQSLIQQVIQVAEKEKLVATVVTMRPYPEQYFGKNKGFFRLTSVKQQYQLFKKAGIQCMCVLNFNADVAEMSPEAFFDRILVAGLAAKHIIIGDDFRFGRNRVGDFHLLSQLAQQHGIAVQRMPSFLLDNVRVSSTVIRRQLEIGELARAQRYLGRPYALEGRVLHGKKLGRTLGYPTLNIAVNEDVCLRGIFVVSVVLGGELHKGVASVGVNPSVAKTLGIRYELSSAILEIHLFDFDREVYGQRVQVLFHKKIRNEVKFDTLAALETAMAADALAAQRYYDSDDSES